jgi:hypothetical protein
MRRLVHLLLLLLLLTAHRIRAQRTRFTFGSFQLRFVTVAGDDNNDSCRSGKNVDGGGALWDETAEDIRSGAETCLRTVQCADFNNQTPFYVGLGNVACVIENEEAVAGDDETITIDFVGGGAMDFNGDVPLEPKMVEQCVQSVLQSNECVKIYASYDARIVSPSTFTASWRSYPDIITASGGGGGNEGDNNGLASQEEDHSSSITTTHTTGTSANMTRPFSVLSGTCSAAVVLAFLVAVFFYRKRRRNHARKNKKQNDAGLSMTDLELVEEAGGGGGGGGSLLAKSDSLLGPKPPKSGELGRMLDEQQQQKSAAAAGAMMMIPMGDHDTPTTIREADASFGTTSTSSEDEYDDAVEVGLQSLQTPNGPYDTRHVADSSTTAIDTDDDGLPAILIPEEKSTFLVVEPGSFCAPFPVETSYDDEPIVTSSETTTTTEPLTNSHTCGILCKAMPSTDLPELGPSSDDDDDLFLVDWRPSDDGGNNNYNNGTRSYESMVEITSDDYESAIHMDDDDDNDDHSCTSSSSPSEDHEFEPDAYWDPDDNSISTADAAGLDAMGTGEFSFLPATVTGNAATATSAPTKNETTDTVRPIESLPPPPLFNWICQGPALCSSSTSSLPSLLGKQQEGLVEDPLSVRQRTKSYCGGGCQPFR